MNEGPIQSRRERQQQEEQGRARRRSIIVALVGVVIALAIGGFAFSRRSTIFSTAPQGGSRGLALSLASRGSQGLPGSSIGGLTCAKEMLRYHVHAYLALYNQGSSVVLPANIGILYHSPVDYTTYQPYCLYPLHTHDQSGVIHVESAGPERFTLGQFFDIWRYTARWDLPVGLSQIVPDTYMVALARAKPSAIHAYVDGKPVLSYTRIELTAHKVITLELGAPLRTPISRFSFPQGE